MEMCHFLIEILYVGLIFKVFDFLNNEELEFKKDLAGTIYIFNVNTFYLLSCLIRPK